MGALGNVFKRILPLIMIICFLCLGITHIFATERNPNPTYLTQETRHSEINNTDINYYTLDTNTYMSNINANKLKEGINIQNSIDTYTATLQAFKIIWQDGYQIFDITKTIANGVILTINTLILPINILLIPLRISSAIILTMLSLIAININSNTGIIKFLNDITTKLNIPLIDPWITNEEPVTENLHGTSGVYYHINDNPFTSPTNQEYIFDFYCVNEENTQWDIYHGIRINYYQPTISNPAIRYELQYLNNNNQWITVATKINSNTTWNTSWSARYQWILVGENSNFAKEDWLRLVVNISSIAETWLGALTNPQWNTPQYPF